MVLHWQITHLILSGHNTKTLFVHGLLHIENIIFTAFPRKVVRKNVHATILKGNMGYDQHSVPDTVAVEFSIVAFVWHSQTCSMASLAILSNFSEEHRTVNSTPPTIPFRTVARTFSDNLSRNSCNMKTFSFFKTSRKKDS